MTVDSDRVRQDRVLLDTYGSFLEAMRLAGGTHITCGQLAGMSALELITMIAPNGIRFVYSCSDKMHTDGGEMNHIRGA